jgi:DMSO/TMAO reductase YedYZ molybdopterin-dependent catalytic subunit
MADDPKDKLDKVVQARMKLKERFEAKMRATPSVADDRPMGTGDKNRHGMPKLPPGQVETKKWPVLDLGVQPMLPPSRWRLFVDGACEHPLGLTWDEFMALPQVDDVSDFHCVTTWSRMDVPWRGVRFVDLMALALPHDAATHVMCHAYDGYTTNLPLEEALKPDVLLVHTADGAPLTREHGGPVRMITPQLYAWKGAKWIKRIELLTADQAGFWEQRGYSMSALPWRNDRYS